MVSPRKQSLLGEFDRPRGDRQSRLAPPVAGGVR
jgi:hypothetical protein